MRSPLTYTPRPGLLQSASAAAAIAYLGSFVVAGFVFSNPLLLVAAGAGAVIALASDFRVMAESAKLAFLFVRVGLAGADMGAAYLLPRLVGLCLLYTSDAADE